MLSPNKLKKFKLKEQMKTYPERIQLKKFKLKEQRKTYPERISMFLRIFMRNPEGERVQSFRVFVCGVFVSERVQYFIEVIYLY